MGASVVNSQQLLDAPQWQGDDVTVRCVHVICETPSVKTFQLQGLSPLRFAYKPGQFISLKVEIDGESLVRAYTVASSPTAPNTLELTIKRDGLVSNWLLDHLQVGSELELVGLGGCFNLDDLPAEQYLFLAGGVGITPLMSMSRYLAAVKPDADIHFIASARSPEELIFAAELKLLARRLPNFKLNLAVDEGACNELLAGPLTEEHLAALVPDLPARTAYCCGPEGYMQAMQGAFAALGGAPEQFHLEHFACTAADREAVAAGVEEEGAVSHQLTIKSSGQAITVDPGQTVLDALEGAGIAVNSACRAGMCGCCKLQALSGEVKASSTQTLTDDEIKQGYFLACACTAESDLELA